jgi:hypothetical protein
VHGWLKRLFNNAIGSPTLKIINLWKIYANIKFEYYWEFCYLSANPWMRQHSTEGASIVDS